jgi:hypothetical protein
VQATARLCAMNLLLHGIGSQEFEPIAVGDALAADPGERFDVVLTNPPFGKKSSTTIVGEEGKVSKERDTVERDDFWATTSNKQLNFVQHVKTLLKQNGRAAVVLPDNVLFEGGAGETIRRKLLHDCDVHTLLRLPTGLFYAQGVKANVLFFDKKPAPKRRGRKKLWIYDLRTNMHFTLKTSTLKREDLDEFVKCYHPENRHDRKPTWSQDNPDGRWRAYDYEDLVNRDKASLDIFWLRDESLSDSDNLPAPEVIAAEIVEDLEAALELTYILVDFENVQPPDMGLLSGEQYQLRIFRGPHQNKLDFDIAESLQPHGDRVKYIQSDRHGKNALDFHIAFYMGRLLQELEANGPSANSNTRFVVISKDGGFDALMSHVQSLGYGAMKAASIRHALGLDEPVTTNGSAIQPTPIQSPPSPPPISPPSVKTPAVKKAAPVAKASPGLCASSCAKR